MSKRNTPQRRHAILALLSADATLAGSECICFDTHH